MRCPPPGLPAIFTAMLEEIRKAFTEAWAAFRTELSRNDPEDQVASLLTAMRRELVAARAELPAYDDAARRAGAEVEREKGLLADCVRRGGLAERIGDHETVRVAAEFAERHRARITVLEEKARAARDEAGLRRREAEEMMRRYKHADANRFALLAEIRAQGARGTLRSAMGPGAPLDDEFDRFASRLDDEAAYADALNELDDTAPPPPPPPDDVEDRLAELKRRMGQA
jgi:phage shock protein A